MDFKLEFAKALNKALALDLDQLLPLIEIPPNPALGDFAFPCFTLSKQLKQAPAEIAKNLAGQLKSPSFSAFAATGPYLNAFLNKSLFAKEILSKIEKEKNKYGHQTLGKGKTVVIDLSSPNIAKPFGIGHLRSTIIGNALANIHSSLGFKVIKINYLGDWGTQFGKLITGYKHFGNAKQLKQNPIGHLLDLYVKVNSDETLQDEARAWFKKLEDGDKESLAFWKKFKTLSLKEFDRLYKLLNVKFDVLSGESLYNTKMEKTVELLKQKRLLEESEGARIVDLEKEKLGKALIQKSDGATLYITRDLTAAIDRYNTYKFTKMLYEVGSEQTLHFNQLFKVLELMGYSWAKDCIHINHGLYLDKDGKKFSTRKGKTIFMIDVLEETIALARKVMEEKNPTLKNKDTVAKAVGIGAVIFADLSNDRVKDVLFDLERMLSFEGETGPYLQYTHARATSILKKATSVKSKIDFKLLQTPEEMIVINLLSQFPSVLKDSAEHYKPHILCHYLLALAQAFNGFYHAHPVLSDDKKQTEARLLLVKSTKQVLATGLTLLGITPLAEM